MKNLTNFIQEKYLIDNNYKIEYTCHPKDKYELRNILIHRLAEDKNADLNDIDVSKITDMGFVEVLTDKGLFEDLDPHNIKIDQWNVSKVTDMSGMFLSCKNFDCDLSNWNVSKVRDMRMMFYRCKKFNCDLNNWNISKNTDIKWMFDECTSLINKPSWYKE